MRSGVPLDATQTGKVNADSTSWMPAIGSSEQRYCCDSAVVMRSA